MKWQTRPRIQESQEFAHDVESIAGAAPPVPGIEGIGGSGTHDDAGLALSESAPKQANAARMNFCRDNYYRGVLSMPERSRGDFNFVGGIYDRRVENVNCFRRHAFPNQEQLLLIVLARKRSAPFFPCSSRLPLIGLPDFQRV